MSKPKPSTHWEEPFWGDTHQPSATAWVQEHLSRREPLIEATINKARLERGRRDEEGRLKMSLLSGPESRLPNEPTEPQSRAEPRPSGQVGYPMATPHISAVEPYEALKANLWVRYPPASMKIVVFVGAASGCGVSTAATNFAATLAQDGAGKVLLVDANVRSVTPQATTEMTMWDEESPDRTLQRLLADGAALQLPTPSSSNLYRLPIGAKGSKPLSLFRSEPFDLFLKRVRQLFAYVVIDAPPLKQHPETLLLAQKADGVILVVESEKTRAQSALWAKQQIENAGGQVLGVVLNKRRYRIPGWLYSRI